MDTGYKSFAENFKACCAYSCTKLAHEKLQSDPKYQESEDLCQELYDALCAKLGEERRLVDDFDVAKNQVWAFSDAYVYQQGFRDCIHLLRFIGLL